jgi:hypothetical protein
MNNDNGSRELAAREWKTKREIAVYYKCSVRSISNFMRRRILPFIKIGRFVRFEAGECDLAMEKFKNRSKYDSLN